MKMTFGDLVMDFFFFPVLFFVVVVVFIFSTCDHVFVFSLVLY